MTTPPSTTITTPPIGYHPGTTAHNNILSFLAQHAQHQPHQTAFRWVPPDVKAQWGQQPHQPLIHHTITYGALWQQIDALAHGLSQLGIGLGHRVLIFIPMSPDLYRALFAVQKLGAIAVFLDSWARADQLGHCAQQAAPIAFIAPQAAMEATQSVPQLAAIRYQIVVGATTQPNALTLDSLMQPGHQHPIVSVPQEHTALITYTTGSSGAPKGANRTHRFLCAQHYAIDQCLPYTAQDVDLPVFPIFSLNNVAAGVQTVLPAIDLAAPAPTDGTLLVAQLQQTQATCCTLSPSLLLAVAHAAKAAGQTLPHLRRAATGGAPISSDDVALFKQIAPAASLHILYGSTEVEPIAHLEASAMPTESGHEGVCVGTVAKGLSVRLLKLHKGPIVLDDQGWLAWEVPSGEVGELVVCGEHVCRDYYNNPGAFAGSKILDADGNVWHRTGDLCRWDDAQRLWVVGRLHNTICRGGQMLFPVKPEVCIKRLPFVQAAAYLGLPDDALGEKAVAAFTVCPQNLADEPTWDFKVQVQRALLHEGIPVDAVFQVDHMPLDPRHHSKVEYAKLREQLLKAQG
jgi:acyl-CoA synthetase (AMP-forming)/AMP-acid ligase II